MLIGNMIKNRLSLNNTLINFENLRSSQVNQKDPINQQIIQEKKKFIVHNASNLSKSINNIINFTPTNPFISGQTDNVQQLYSQISTSSSNSNLIFKLIADRKTREQTPRNEYKEKIKLQNEKESFSKTTLKDSIVIFDHLFINQNGDNNVQVNNLVFDNYFKEFILPDQSNL